MLAPPERQRRILRHRLHTDPDSEEAWTLLAVLERRIAALEEAHERERVETGGPNLDVEVGVLDSGQQPVHRLRYVPRARPRLQRRVWQPSVSG
jgi:hypothetical protein